MGAVLAVLASGHEYPHVRLGLGDQSVAGIGGIAAVHCVVAAALAEQRFVVGAAGVRVVPADERCTHVHAFEHSGAE